MTVTFEVHVRPGAKRTSVGGAHDGALTVAVTAPPADGRANEAVCAAVADAFGVRTSAVCLVRGHTSRRKVVAIDLDEHRGRARLAELLRGRARLAELLHGSATTDGAASPINSGPAVGESDLASHRWR